jgi:hypothetical protein
MRAEDRRKELNRSAQQGSVDPPNNANLNAMLSSRQMIDVGVMVRGLSKAESLQKQDKHVEQLNLSNQIYSAGSNS